MAKYRAWAMVVRQRGAGSRTAPGEMFTAESSVDALVKADPKKFRASMSVYGNFDLIVPIEADHLKDIHDAVNSITAGGGVLYTTTYIAVPEGDAVSTWKPNAEQFCVGICTEPGKDVKKDVRKKLLDRGADAADIVFGDFDVIALITPQGTPKDALLQMVDNIGSIRKTTTFLRLF